MTASYRPVPPQVDLPELDHAILSFWRDNDVFAKSLARTQDGERWTFYEGPPTANGQPGAHHVEARVFKDMFPRYQTMRGRFVERKAGWDCHGLPVEVAVEKELGISGKPQIEEYGVAEFNAKCRESVKRYVGAFTELTERMGYWVDLSEAYWTMNPSYVESVWWSLKVIFDKGLLVRDYRISPYCPRCGTTLSDHELGQPDVYQMVADPSVFVRMPLTSGPLAGKASLLIWTTTPWTLVSNTAVAVHPEVEYVAATDGKETLIVAADLLAVLGEGWKVTERFRGAEMERWTYSRPFSLVELEDANYVVVDPYVSTEDGTGLVHQAPAFGEDDYRVGRKYGLPVVNPVRPDGTFEESLNLVGGKFFKQADDSLVVSLRERGLLFRGEKYEHTYPHCWRCGTALLYYALPSWFIRTTERAEALLAENEKTNWFPDTIKHGRYGEWLRNNVDWALSRNRYWGTPLPIWECDEGHLTCVGSLAELGDLAGADHGDVDPHRPFVDDIAIACPDCGGEARRVPEVIDAWYDSGSMPFAQFGYPYAEGSKATFEQAYPAQFICEAVDQTRGWFYSLMAVGTLVFDRSSYENVLCLGLILAEDGRKMSKHLGNVLEPIGLMERHGADAVRWFMACSGSPWTARRVGDTTIQEVVRKVILTYWNTVAFHTLYASLADWTPSAPVESSNVLDRWLSSETARLVRDLTEAYETFDTQRIGQRLGEFVDDLSNWYVRRSRRRFWAGDAEALSTLHATLEALTLVMAPLVPFVTERVWQDLVRPVRSSAPVSVHLADWPGAGAVDDALSTQVTLARRVVELGRAARAEAKVKTRQPLALALVGAPGWSSLPEELRQEVAEELNVLRLQGLVEAGEELVEYAVKPNFRTLGKRFGKGTPTVASAVSAADAGVVATALRESGSAVVTVDGAEVSLTADEVIVSERPREGWAVANAHGETVALDLHVTDALRRAGLAREVVRLIQEARKARGLEVSDRIELRWSAESDELAAALREHGSFLGDEVLATSVEEDAPEPDAGFAVELSEDLGLTLWFRKASAS
ncbi:isoleucine--tRNA ligase [Tenggerimyces flavus]|uniref:Isoleucine--tRNA ligase n=1 Tax=Tenggerimyces flavus TaxID=1708749 RepID=A0ABV7Y866_9ACTN|nr:isoleucine--tRNA ligase [Tenggerimyces flavus]MBM7788572.1 isoleucyl-tRNA synthetase [Tenggerimyces flavus]